jgi:hypothetical protein
MSCYFNLALDNGEKPSEIERRDRAIIAFTILAG